MGPLQPGGDQATIGVDIGGTKVLAVLVATDGSILDDIKVATPATGEAMLDVVAEVVIGLGAGHGADPPQRAPDRGRARPARVSSSTTDVERVTHVGIGAPGLVDRDGVLRFAPNLPGVVGLPMREGLEARVPGVRFRTGNDATCAGWAEWTLGAAQGTRNSLMVTLGTGIGGGIVTEGVIFEGSNGFAGEIGHMVIDPHGPLCPCGRQGCWERFASGSGLGRLGREAAMAGRAHRVVELAGGDAESVRGEHVTRAAAEGDQEAAAVMKGFAWWLALGLANLANVFDPDCIVVGGGLIAAGSMLIEPTRAAFAQLVEAPSHRPEIRILAAALGEQAGAIGAALLARPAQEAP